jgi:hypothetical protein
MPSVFVLHWKPQEAFEKIRDLQEAGFEVFSDLPAGPGFIKDLEALALDALVIDLSRLPSQGRDMAVQIRSRKGTRSIPILFVEGDPVKVAPITELLPDAVYTNWEDLVRQLNLAISTGPHAFRAPGSVFAAYAGRPLAAKLGIKAGYKMVVMGAPDGFVESLGELPAGASIGLEADAAANLFLWFIHSRTALQDALEGIVENGKKAPVWIAWPKKGVLYQTDLTQQFVRQSAMQAGLVDYKICSVNDRWSALLFTWRGVTSQKSSLREEK